jgi:predicted Zn-dependent protease
MFQILGKSTTAGDADEQQILQSIRSFRALNDPARQNPTPDRVHLATVTGPSTFEAAVKAIEPDTQDVEVVAILNNELADQDVRTGERIKVIRPGKTH